jgi:lipopolysaccharide/colanic/teichoic acid biosynthesis glycosyltransferase/GGDEF domain-containing protein
MKLTGTKELKKNKIINVNQLQSAACPVIREVIDPEYDLYNEIAFRQMLCTERKRTERSNKPFLLLLINVEKINLKESAADILKDIIFILSRSIREIDLFGWYRYHDVMGIIFTEIVADDARTAMGVIDDKLKRNLLRELPSGLVDDVAMYFHDFPEKLISGSPASTVNITFYPDVTQSSSLHGFSHLLKRLIDIIGSLAGLAIFLPAFIIIPILIRCTSEGPILFRQERIGRFGRKFIFLKFRTMNANNDDAIHRDYIRKFITENGCANRVENGVDSSPVYKLQDDPRITPLGRLLRKSSLDEIPQFLNVLMGEMSLVGPRPAIPYELENYDIWHRQRLLQVKPGITGLWQVRGRSSTTFNEMVRLDLKYIRDRSLWLDIKILLLTPWVILKSKGAY